MMLRIFSRNLSAFPVPWRRSYITYSSNQFLNQKIKDQLCSLRTNVEKRNPQLVESMEKEAEEKAKGIISSINQMYKHYGEKKLQLPAEGGSNPREARHYEMMYGFMSKQYTIHCKRTQEKGLQPIEDVVFDISTAFESQYPYHWPIDESIIERYFHACWAVSQNIQPSKQLAFEDDAVTNLWRGWLQGHDVIDCSGEFDLSPKVVQCWFNVFETIISIPKATSDNPMICSMSPPEYYRYELYEEVLWEFHFELEDIEFKCEKSFDEDIKKLVYWLGVADRFDAKMSNLPTKEYLQVKKDTI